MSSLKTDITWLHLSDFHLRENLKWSQDVVLSSLINDIRNRYSERVTADLLFITGDISFSGRKEEYLLAEEFIRDLQSVTGVPSERLFLVPGNHDINRDLEQDAFRGAADTLQNELEIDKFFATQDRRRTLFRRQREFRRFVNRIAPPDGRYSSVSFSHSKCVTVGAINITVLLLDSAWLAEGDIADAANLLVGERQIIDATVTHDNALTFALLHHPFAWLREFEQIPIENLLLERAHIVLRGHVHAVDWRAVEALERRLNIFTAGAGYETRTAENSYNWTTVDLATGDGRTIVHKYVHASKSWQPSVPTEWTLTKTIPPVDFDESSRFFAVCGGRFAEYRAAMLSGHSPQCPRIINGQPVLLSFEVSLPDDENPIGNVIKRLRNLFFWRRVLSPSEWQDGATALAHLLENELLKLAAISSELSEIIEDQEKHSATLARILGETDVNESPVFDQLNDSAKRGDWDQVLTIIDRWRASENFLSTTERKNMARMAIQALLELNRVDDAKKLIVAFMTDENLEPGDFALAALCSYRTEEYEQASQYIKTALDNGFPKDQLTRLALLVAGKTGDKELRERVLHD